MIRHDFVVRNEGDALLQISDVHPSCGCTTAGAWPHELAPGKSGIIPIQINSQNLSGNITKQITVTSNDKNNPRQVLLMRGEVARPIEVRPSTAQFRLPPGATNAPPVDVVRISNTTTNPIEITGSTSGDPAFAVTSIKTLEAGKDYEVEIAPQPPFTGGKNTTITLHTSWSNYSIQIPAYLMLEPAFQVSPSYIMAPPRVDHELTYTINVRNNAPGPVTLSDPTSSDATIKLALSERIPGREFALSATLPAGYHAPSGPPVTISIKTSNTSQPVVSVQLRQRVSFVPPPPAQQSQNTRMPPPVPPGAH